MAFACSIVNFNGVPYRRISAHLLIIIFQFHMKNSALTTRIFEIFIHALFVVTWNILILGLPLINHVCVVNLRWDTTALRFA